MRVVLDTNIYISALISPGGKSFALVQTLARDRKIEIFYSDAILQETLRVLRVKFRWPAEDLQEAETLLSDTARRNHPTVELNAVPDDADVTAYSNALLKRRPTAS